MTRYLSVMISKVAEQCFISLESEKFRTIDLPKLMPALRNCPYKDMRRARLFVENHCIKLRKCRDSSVHNMCFYLYAQSDDLSEILDYLKKEENKIIAGHEVYIDLNYALNVCKQKLSSIEFACDGMSQEERDSRNYTTKINNLKKA